MITHATLQVNALNVFISDLDALNACLDEYLLPPSNFESKISKIGFVGVSH